ncbi:MAG: hypothetical protein ACRDPP_00465 [Gaiellaceae bacterium]
MRWNKNEPLFLPKGSVRAVLTMVLVAITTAVMFIPIPSGKDDVKAMFVLLTGIAVRDYFSSRDRQAEREERAPEDAPVPSLG